MALVPEVDALVVGAGIAGLAAALALQEAGAEVLVIDASDRVGGVMRSDHTRRYIVERGPNTIQVKAPLRRVLEQRFPESPLRRAEAASRLRWIYSEGALVAVPMSPWALARTPRLRARGKWRLLLEPFVRRAKGGEESVAEFVTRRLGAQALEGFVAPFLTGVYAGDPAQLGAAAVFPRLVEWEQRHSSIVLGALASLLQRGGEARLSGIHSARQGLGPFARSLSELLREPPALGVRALELRREGADWGLTLSSPAGDATLRARRIVLAIPAPEAAELLRPLDARAGELLAGIDHAPIVSLPLGVQVKDFARPPQGFGFLVPREAGLDLLGCLFMSQLFPGRAPAGHELLQCMLGGVQRRELVEEPEDRLVERARQALDQALGLRGEVESLGAARWPRAVPQPGRDHPRRIAELLQRVAGLPGLSLAGSYVAGVGVSDSFASGLAAAVALAAPR